MTWLVETVRTLILLSNNSWTCHSYHPLWETKSKLLTHSSLWFSIMSVGSLIRWFLIWKISAELIANNVTICLTLSIPFQSKISLPLEELIQKKPWSACGVKWWQSNSTWMWMNLKRYTQVTTPTTQKWGLDTCGNGLLQGGL